MFLIQPEARCPHGERKVKSFTAEYLPLISQNTLNRGVIDVLLGLNSKSFATTRDASKVNVINPTQYVPLPGISKNLLASVVSKTPLPVL